MTVFASTDGAKTWSMKANVDSGVIILILHSYIPYFSILFNCSYYLLLVFCLFCPWSSLGWHHPFSLRDKQLQIRHFSIFENLVIDRYIIYLLYT